MWMLHRLQEAAPLELARPLGEQTGVGVGRADRQAAARVLGDVAVVDIEGVERLRREGCRLEERLRALHGPVGEAAEEELVEHVPAAAGALRGDRHLLAV